MVMQRLDQQILSLHCPALPLAARFISHSTLVLDSHLLAMAPGPEHSLTEGVALRRPAAQTRRMSNGSKSMIGGRQISTALGFRF
jgi:uncharacterized protein YgbK (DUF1537 family)